MDSILSTPHLARYILPGIVAMLVLIVCPYWVLDADSIPGWGAAELGLLLFASLFLGYALDAAGAYKYANRRKYEEMLRNHRRILVLQVWEKGEFSDSALKANANRILAYVWAKEPSSYREIVEEPRAKWVLAMETAFLLRWSGIFWVCVVVSHLVFNTALRWSFLDGVQLWKPVLLATMALGASLILCKRGFGLAEFANLAIESLVSRIKPKESDLPK